VASVLVAVLQQFANFYLGGTGDLAVVLALAAVLLPFAVLVAASRVVLGLHYPTDVAAGAALGAMLAVATLRFWPA
jgi:membrane-associated phospholipid phosphatase